MRYEFRTLTNWHRPVTKHPRRALFKAPWSTTLAQLGAETEKLGASLVVIEVDAAPDRIRLDGMLHANARVNSHLVRISFDSRHGPLMYASDTYDRWQDNVRAIVLSLEALRAVDRYGVSSSGEQYAGWTAISNRPAKMTRAQAAEFLAHLVGDPALAEPIGRDPAARAAAFRIAARKTHPDHGGDPDTFQRLNEARRLLNEERQ